MEIVLDERLNEIAFFNSLRFTIDESSIFIFKFLYFVHLTREIKIKIGVNNVA